MRPTVAIGMPGVWQLAWMYGMTSSRMYSSNIRWRQLR